MAPGSPIPPPTKISTLCLLRSNHVHGPRNHCRALITPRRRCQHATLPTPVVSRSNTDASRLRRVCSVSIKCLFRFRYRPNTFDNLLVVNSMNLLPEVDRFYSTSLTERNAIQVEGEPNNHSGMPIGGFGEGRRVPSSWSPRSSAPASGAGGGVEVGACAGSGRGGARKPCTTGGASCAGPGGRGAAPSLLSSETHRPPTTRPSRRERAEAEADVRSRSARPGPSARRHAAPTVGVVAMAGRRWCQPVRGSRGRSEAGARTHVPLSVSSRALWWVVGEAGACGVLVLSGSENRIPLVLPGCC
jgi:hypothetical protein